MTDQIVHTPPPQVRPAPQRHGSAAEVLRGRAIAIAGDAAYRVADGVNRADGALALTGSNAGARAKKLAASDPDLVMFIEPTYGSSFAATPDKPMQDGFVSRKRAGQSPLLPARLDDFLQGQLTHGAAAAMLPTGWLAPGDRQTLDSFVAAANRVERRDVIVPVFADPAWLGTDRQKFIKRLSQIEHPVVVAFTSPENPISVDLVGGYRELFQATNAIPWRADTIALDAVAFGASAAAIGVIPSLRKASAPHEENNARTPKDARPHPLIGELLAYVRTATLISDHYVNRESPACTCPGHEGRRIDAFTASSADKEAGQLHNAFTMGSIVRQLLTSGDAEQLWASIRLDAFGEWSARRLLTGASSLRTQSYLPAWRKLD